MELQAEISIDCEETTSPNLRGWVNNFPFDALKKISDIGFDMEPRGRDEYFAIKVSEPADSPKVQQIREILNSTGLVEFDDGTRIPADRAQTHYAFNYIRKFSKAEIEDAQYLRMNIRGLGYIASLADTTEAGYVLRVDNKQKNSIAIGWLDVIITPYASDVGRVDLEEYGFKGLEFRPALFDKPEKVTKPLWMMTSSITLPPCLLPVETRPFDNRHSGTQDEERGWDDKGRVQVVLRYDKDEIANLGDFDFARTREQVGSMKKHYRHHYVVSQRFRKAILDGKHRWIDFVPVKMACR